MQTITRDYKVYEYDELSDDAKQKVLENLYDINVSGDYWYFDDMPSDEVLTAAGIGFDRRQVCFDLDRGAFLYFDTHDHSRNGDRGIWVEDQSKLADALLKDKVIDRKTANAVKRGSLYFAISCRHYGGGNGRNTLELNDAYATNDDKAYELRDKADHDAIDEWLSDVMQTRLSELRDCYKGYTSREAIEDTIRANEYTFLEDGSMFS